MINKHHDMGQCWFHILQWVLQMRRAVDNSPEVLLRHLGVAWLYMDIFLTSICHIIGRNQFLDYQLSFHSWKAVTHTMVLTIFGLLHVNVKSLSVQWWFHILQWGQMRRAVDNSPEVFLWHLGVAWVYMDYFWLWLTSPYRKNPTCWLQTLTSLLKGNKQ